VFCYFKDSQEATALGHVTLKQGNLKILYNPVFTQPAHAAKLSPEKRCVVSFVSSSAVDLTTRAQMISITFTNPLAIPPSFTNNILFHFESASEALSWKEALDAGMV
jgi:hypothetical protein